MANIHTYYGAAKNGLDFSINNIFGWALPGSTSPPVPAVFSTNGISKKIFASTYGSLYFRFYYYPLTVPSDNGSELLTIYDDTGAAHGGLRFTAAQKIKYRRADGTVLGTGTLAISSAVWVCIELFITISDSVGVINTRVNGVDDINLTGLDTRPSTTAVIGGYGITFVTNISDLFGFIQVNDSTGSFDNTWPGQRSFAYSFPTGDNATDNAFTKSTGGNGYALVDEAQQNADTDYVVSTVTGQQQGFTFPSHGLASPAVVRAVAIEYVERNGTGGRIKNGIRSGSTEDLPAATSLSGSYNDYIVRYPQDPNITGDWDLTTSNTACEALVESVIP